MGNTASRVMVPASECLSSASRAGEPLPRPTTISVSSPGRAMGCTSRPSRTARRALRARSMVSAADSTAGGRSATVQRPSREMRMGTGS